MLEGHEVWPQSHAKIQVEPWSPLSGWLKKLDGELHEIQKCPWT
jgi:hypothetical protein